jgi:hypothetical protein
MKLTSLGIDFERFEIGLNLFTFPEAELFIARQSELIEIH